MPLTQQIAFEVLDGLDLPPGVVNLVNGGREVVEGILDHPGIDAVSFVGSAPVARLVYERAAEAGKRVQALGGAKNHMVVMPDAVIDKTVDGHHRLGLRRGRPALHGRLGRGHGRRGARAADAARSRRPPSALRVGDGLEEAIDVGPVVSEAARDRIVAAIEQRRRRRRRRSRSTAAIRRDGRRRRLRSAPTILDGVEPGIGGRRARRSSARCSRSSSAGTLDEAIEIVNAQPLRQRHSIFTESGAVGPRATATRSRRA